jgi:CHAT domain
MNSHASTKKILFLASNPQNTLRLRLDEEVREIEEGLSRVKSNNRFELVHKWAVRSRDIHRYLLDVSPDIVHFSGHGVGENGLVFEDESGQSKFVKGEALASLFRLFCDHIKCVVLNGCYSQIQAEAIAQHVSHVIGLKHASNDRAGIIFSIGFYDALAAGRSFEFAHQLGCTAIQIEGLTKHLNPVLISNQNIKDLELNISSSPKKEIEKKLNVPFFENIINLVQQRIEFLSDMQVAYYIALIFSGIEERFLLRGVENFADNKCFTIWFMLRGLSNLDLIQQQKINNHILQQEYESDGCNLWIIDDLINAAGGIQGEHYERYGGDVLPSDKGYELLLQVFSNDEFSAMIKSLQCLK